MSKAENKMISILGCGWLGLPLGEALVLEGHNVCGSTTSVHKIIALEKVGMKPFLIDLDSNLSETSDAFFKTDVLVICVPPRTKSGGIERYGDQMNVVAECCRRFKIPQVVFISSTSVYPELNRVVTEEDVAEESYLTKIENLFTGDENFSTVVIRFGGLVGPGRHPGAFLSGKVISGGKNPVNIIHRDDCTSILSKIIGGNQKDAVLNACADQHPMKEQFYLEASIRLGVPPPVFKDESSMGFKIVSSAKLKQQLNYKFVYPDPMKMVY